MMGPFDSFDRAEATAKGLKQYRGWSELQKQVFEGSVEQKQDGRWGSKFTAAARDRIFEEVMCVAGLTETIEIPTLFVQPKAGLNRTDLQLKPYRKYFSQLEIRSVPGNHWAFLVEPELFERAIVDRLKREASRSRT